MYVPKILWQRVLVDNRDLDTWVQNLYSSQPYHVIIKPLRYKAKIEIVFVSPYVTDPKKWPYPNFIFHDLEIKNIFFLFTKIYTYFVIFPYSSVILLQNS